MIGQCRMTTTSQFPRDDLTFTVHMALRKAEHLWPKRRRPGDHDRLKIVADAVVDHIEPLQHPLFPAGAGARPHHAGSLGPLAGSGGERRRRMIPPLPPLRPDQRPRDPDRLRLADFRVRRPRLRHLSALAPHSTAVWRDPLEALQCGTLATALIGSPGGRLRVIGAPLPATRGGARRDVSIERRRRWRRRRPGVPQCCCRRPQ